MWTFQRLFPYSHISPRTLCKDSAMGENMFCLNMKNKYANWANWANSIPCTLGIFAERREREEAETLPLCVRVCAVWTLAAAIIAVSSECKQRNWVSATNYNSPFSLSLFHPHTHWHCVCQLVGQLLLLATGCLHKDAARRTWIRDLPTYRISSYP